MLTQAQVAKIRGNTTEKLFDRLRAIPAEGASKLTRFDLVEAGIPVGRSCGSGAYRTTYTIKGFPDIVLKIPVSVFDFDFYDNDWGEGENFESPAGHVAAEMNNIDIINRSKDSRYSLLQRFLPTVYFYDSKTGIQVEKKYRPYPGNTLKDPGIVALTALFKAVLLPGQDDESDFAHSNIMIDESDRPILVDIGYVILKGRK